MAEKEIHTFYYHIDNGGFTVRVYDSEPDEEACWPWVTFSESFFGYATSSLTIHNQGAKFLRELAQNLHTAADKLDEYTRAKERSAPVRREQQRREKETKQLFALANKLGYQFLDKPEDQNEN